MGLSVYEGSSDATSEKTEKIADAEVGSRKKPCSEYAPFREAASEAAVSFFRLPAPPLTPTYHRMG